MNTPSGHREASGCGSGWFMISCALNVLLQKTGLLDGERAGEYPVILYMHSFAAYKPVSFAWKYKMGFSGPLAHVPSNSSRSSFMLLARKY